MFSDQWNCGRRIAISLGVFALMSGGVRAQSLAELRGDAESGHDVLTYGSGWGQQRHSRLDLITPRNVGKLTPTWALSLNHTANASTQPLLIDGTLFVALHDATVAVDALSGRQKWRVPVELPTDVNAYLCCGIQSRGMAALDGVLYRTTLDAHVVAVSQRDGKVLWKSKRPPTTSRATA